MPSITASSSVLSLYIPIISKTTSEAYIKKMFDSNKIGKIMRVDFVFNKSKDRNEAFIHFDEWFNTPESSALKEDILNPNTKTQFKYGTTTKFWPLLVNKNAHMRVNNPNYEVIDSIKIKIDYKKSLKIEPKEVPFNNEYKKSKTLIKVS
tara:strand:+ start:2766 stop:3215 length:450 start_codon:yes stop_codon:yes gene_type:complete